MNEKVMYQNLYNRLRNISNSLYSAINNLDSAIANTDNAIVVNGICYKQSDLRGYKNVLEDRRRKLVNIYIPEVKKRLAGLGND